MPKLLIVDDSTTDRVRATGIASRWLECTIRQCDSGVDALEQMEHWLPDIVLTDLQMPEMDGLELVTALKEEHPQIPVILMTAQGSEDVAASALRRGAASYVPKPRLAEDLIGILNRVYDAARLENSHSRLMHYVSDANLRFELPNDLNSINSCVRYLLDLLRCMPLGDVTERMRVGIALQEAIENACYLCNLEIESQMATLPEDLEQLASLRRSAEPYRHRRIHIHARISRTQAEFTIGDDGRGFDVDALAGHEGPNADGSGRGTTLMRCMMDEVIFADSGRQVTLIKNAVQEDSVSDDSDQDDPMVSSQKNES
ncbi:MAG: response regulator [Planctomycetaceae bacterium]